MFDWIGDFFKAMFDMIPKIMYLLYSSAACILDALQLFFRKLAGLDVVWMEDPVTGDLVMSSGDIVTQFITGILGINTNGFEYSALSTVFWSMFVFGIIICFAATFVAVIKSHYTYDEKAAKGPMQYVYTAGKAIINIVAVPAIIVLGLYVSQALLTALDSITSTSSSAIVELYGQDAVTDNLQPSATSRSLANDSANPNEKSYIYYDVFGFASSVVYDTKEVPVWGIDIYDTVKIASTQMSFSGVLFKTAAYNASRARNRNWYSSNSGNIPGYDWKVDGDGKFTLFKNAKGDNNLADMIDTAFACNLHMKSGVTITLNYANNTSLLAWVSPTYFTNFLAFGSKAFSKFNIGLVWYFYDLWQFNFIAGFGACAVALSIFINVILGLISRLFMSLVLFLIAPPLFGLAPLDGGQAAKNWREQFMKQILMTYGAIVGMNLVLLLLPYFNQIHFFNIGIADYLAQTLIIIAGLVTIKAVIATVSAIIGAADASKTGEDMKQDVAEGLGKGVLATAGAAKLGMKANSFLRKKQNALFENLLNDPETSPVGAAIGGVLTGGLGGAFSHIMSKTKLGEWGAGKLNNVKKLIKGKAAEELADYNQIEKAESILQDENIDEQIRNGSFATATNRQQALSLKLQQEAGMSEQDANAYVEQMRAAATSGGSLATARQNFANGNANSSYGRRNANNHILTASGNLRSQRMKTLKTIAQANQAKHAAKVKAFKDTAFTPVKIFDSMFKGDKFYDAFLDKSNIRKPTDHARRTADATEAMLQQMQQNRELEAQRDQISAERWRATQTHYSNTETGISNLNTGVDNVNKSVLRVDTSVREGNKSMAEGFEGVQSGQAEQRELTKKGFEGVQSGQAEQRELTKKGFEGIQSGQAEQLKLTKKSQKEAEKEYKKRSDAAKKGHEKHKQNEEQKKMADEVQEWNQYNDFTGE